MKLSRLKVNSAYGTMFHKNAVFTKTEYLQETGRTRNIVCLIIACAANAMI